MTGGWLQTEREHALGQQQFAQKITATFGADKALHRASTAARDQTKRKIRTGKRSEAA